MVPDTRPGGEKLIPVVVNVTSALPVVHAAVPWLQVARARLASVAAVPLLAIASVVIQPYPVIKSARALADNATTAAAYTASRNPLESFMLAFLL